MKELKAKEMMNVKGGSSLSVSSMLNAVAKVISTVFSVGQAIGSAIRRGRSGNYCSY